jgi:hypothetical protein
MVTGIIIGLPAGLTRSSIASLETTSSSNTLKTNTASLRI